MCWFYYSLGWLLRIIPDNLRMALDNAHVDLVAEQARQAAQEPAAQRRHGAAQQRQAKAKGATEWLAARWLGGGTQARVTCYPCYGITQPCRATVQGAAARLGGWEWHTATQSQS